ncbi:hypothetical protein ABRY23_07855 [Melioribacteraceae bacterium 4301-Me]|uniref:hypothetical protein n=1 Tax=Pyranulibacter aquaticus TaxID=3163344 RepID=UPI003598CC59
MSKKNITVIFLSLFIFNNIFSQQPSIKLSVFADLCSIDFTALAATNSLSGQPRVLFVQISPNNLLVTLKGKIEWQRDKNFSYEPLFNFTTEEFRSRDFYNDELGITIKIANSSANSALANENIKRGKPSGNYRLTFSLFDSNGNYLSEASTILSFANPSQTISIISPQSESQHNVGSIIAMWNEVPCAAYYTIKANVRTSKSQTLEEALNSGNPLINDKNVGNVTSVNLIEYKDREFLPGQEVVLQVSAFVPGVGGGTRYYSNIVNFYLTEGSAVTKNFVDEQLVRIANFLSKYLSNDVIEKLKKGEITKNELKITTDDGRVLSFVDLMDIISNLENDPHSVIEVKFISK